MVWSAISGAVRFSKARRPTPSRSCFTQYDDGNAFARFLPVGLGQIHFDGNVVFTDATTGQEIGESKVSKDFSFGGVYVAATHIEDVGIRTLGCGNS